MGTVCDHTFYPNYGPLSRHCRREGMLRTCGHRLCDKHARRHETVCMPPLPVAQTQARGPVGAIHTTLHP